jgi:uncharacterized damage-inducible protein DinB
MTNRLLATVIALWLSCPLAASAQTDPVVASLKGLNDITTTNIRATAETLDEALFSFRPTEEVRSMGQILGHIAGAQYTFCSVAAGETNPNSENFEETATTKAQLIAALEGGFAYCTEVYAGMTDAKGAESVSFFGTPMAVSGVLAFNSAHNYEHYGNLVTYMRLNGVVPPSSR